MCTDDSKESIIQGEDGNECRCQMHNDVKRGRAKPKTSCFQGGAEENSNVLKYSSTLVFDSAPFPPPAVPRAFLGEAGAITSGSATSKRKT